MKLRLLACGAVLGAVAAAALAQDIPVPKVMAGIPADKGSWRMEALEMPGAKGEMARGMGPITICQTAAKAMSGDDTPGQANRCRQKLVEDTASRAVIETTCPPPQASTMRSTITRTGPRVYEVATVTTEGGKAETMRARMTYAGACSEKDAVVSMPKNSPMCQQGAAQMASMNPEQACKGMAGAQRDQCVQQMTRARAQFDQMCK
jgi:hypothetical protein